VASTPLPPCRHRAQAAHNRQVAQQLATISPLWGWVAAFYSAMHLVNEYASFRGQALTNHIERNDWVLHSTDLAAIRAHYKALFERSCIARYDCPPLDAPSPSGVAYIES